MGLGQDDAGDDVPVERYRAPALEKGLDIIEALADRPDGLTATELAAAIDRSLGEIFRILQVLERRGYLSKNPWTDQYRATSRLLEVGFRATPAQNIVYAAGPVMLTLSQTIRQSCHLVLAAPGKALVIAQQDGPTPTNFSVRLGSVLDYLQSASGLVLLALSSEERRQRLLQGQVIPDHLRERMAHVAAQGYEHRASIRTQGVRDISYPVRDFNNEVICALTVPYLRLIDGSQAVDEDAARIILGQAASQLSMLLGASS
ncbi:IclR family transcriptional regulator [Sphingomonas sp. FW199]|uniref:IclR family transcriptional regulator n=1 Tax=Sphingomonas sp. FW199 TaxID=3400217 RepID=UPI003CEB0E67